MISADCFIIFINNIFSVALETMLLLLSHGLKLEMFFKTFPKINECLFYCLLKIEFFKLIFYMYFIMSAGEHDIHSVHL